MATRKIPRSSGSLSRRDFLKVAGLAISSLAFSQVPDGLTDAPVSIGPEPLPAGWGWAYRLPRHSESDPNQWVIPRTIWVDHIDRGTIEIPCQMVGNVIETPDGVLFDGASYLITSSSGEFITLQDQFANLGFSLPAQVLVPGTQSYFRVQSAGQHFPVMAATKLDNLCVPSLWLANTGTALPHIGYRFPGGEIVSQSAEFPASILQDRFYVTQVTRGSLRQEVPGFPGDLGVNYWHGQPKQWPPDWISNDNNELFCQSFILQTNEIDEFVIGVSPDLQDFATGLLSDLYVDPCAHTGE